MPARTVELSFLLLLLFGSVSASINSFLQPRLFGKNIEQTSSYTGQGYSCNGVIFNNQDLQKALKNIKQGLRYKWITLSDNNQFGDFYNGPPFTKRYTLWPVSLTTDSRRQAKSGPYRIVLDNKFQLFSMIVSQGIGVQECKSLQRVSNHHMTENYYCGQKLFTHQELVLAAEKACPRMFAVRTWAQKFPARYDGNHYLTYGSQRYIYPIEPNKLYTEGTVPGPDRVVLNSACKIVGAVTINRNGDTARCTEVDAGRA